MFSAEKHARLVEQHRLEVAQLKREASIHRIKVIRVNIIFLSLRVVVQASRGCFFSLQYIFICHLLSHIHLAKYYGIPNKHAARKYSYGH